MEPVEIFLKESGMAPEFALPEILTDKILHRMERGLAEEGNLMLPSFAPGAGAPPLGQPVAVLDVGGTYLRRARVTYTKTGPLVEEYPALKTPGRESPLAWSGYIEALAESALPLLEPTNRLCLCFSHPVEMTQEMDGRVLFFSKEVAVSGARGRLICAELRSCLLGRGIRLSNIGLVNDTVAALLGGAAELGRAGEGSYDALVFATGLNLCLELPEGRIPRLGRTGSALMPVNTEAGHLDIFPGGEADVLLDQRSAAPGEGLLEKKVSGRYFGELTLITLRLAAERGVFSKEGSGALMHLEQLDTTQALSFLSREGLLYGSLPEEADKKAAEDVIRALCDRTGGLLCALLCASMLLRGAGNDTARPARTILQGAMLERNPVLRESLETHMTRYAGKNLGLYHEFVGANNVNYLGAAAALLRRNMNKL